MLLLSRTGDAFIAPPAPARGRLNREDRFTYGVVLAVGSNDSWRAAGWSLVGLADSSRMVGLIVATMATMSMIAPNVRIVQVTPACSMSTPARSGASGTGAHPMRATAD